MVKVSEAVAGGFTAIVSAIYQQGVEQSLPWIVAMTCVVLVDLATGMRKVWLMGVEKLRWSKGVRCTMSKLVTYWAFAVGAVMVDYASGCEYAIAKWACLLVCAIEGCSIIGNILRPHNVEINVFKLIKNIGKKYDVDMDGVVTKSKKKID